MVFPNMCYFQTAEAVWNILGFKEAVASERKKNTGEVFLQQGTD